MNINKYGLKFDNDRIGQLVKEETYAYDMNSCVIDSPEKAAELIEFVFDGSNLTQEAFWLIALNGARREGRSVRGLYSLFQSSLSTYFFTVLK